jgi:hypothetical protein
MEATVMNTPHPMTTLNLANEQLKIWLTTLRLGRLRRSGPLAVAPVYCGGQEPTMAYRTLAEAIQSGEAVISEHASASVPTLQVLNRSSLPVLILDGDEVVGGLQNRVANTTLLVPSRSTFDLPVSCVEHGRWHETQTTFGAGESVHPSLRRQKAEQVTSSFLTMAQPIADQAAVWAEVDTRHRRTGTTSATSALRDAYVERSGDLEATERALTCPYDGALGIVAFMDGHALCADLFDRPSTLDHYWSRLVRSYALEALDARPNAEPRLDSAVRLLQRPVHATLTPFPSPGLGVDVRITGTGVVGAALLYEGSVVHAALFRRRSSTPRTQLRTPGERARRLDHFTVES